VNEIEILEPRPFKRVEIGGSAGLGYPIKDRLFFTIRGSSSLLPVRDHASESVFRWNLGQYNAVMSFLFKYRF